MPFHIFESKRKLFQPFLFPIIQCLSLCPKIKSSNQTNWFTAGQYPMTNNYFKAWCWLPGVEPHWKEGLQFFFCQGFLSRILTIQRKGEAISLTSLYHFHLLYRHLDISWVITAESSPLHTASSWTWTRNLVNIT